MGAADFRVVGSGPTMEAAFRAARSEAQFMHGHGGYTGTIAEKDSVALIESGVWEPEQARERAMQLFDASDPRIDSKWGPAGAIEIEPAEGQRRWYFFGWASD